MSPNFYVAWGVSVEPTAPGDTSGPNRNIRRRTAIRSALLAGGIASYVGPFLTKYGDPTLQARLSDPIEINGHSLAAYQVEHDVQAWAREPQKGGLRSLIEDSNVELAFEYLPAEYLH